MKRLLFLLFLLPLPLLAGESLVPVSAVVQPQTMYIQVLDVNGVETVKLSVPATSRLVVSYGGQPTPAPFPKPPVPIPGKRKVIILEETSDRTPAQAAIITSPKLRSYLESKGHPLKVTDVDNVPTENVPRSPLPLLIIEDGAGNPIYSGALPATVEDTIETIKAHGG